MLVLSYINPVINTIERAIKKIKVFEKIYLKPNELKSVRILLEEEDFSYYDRESSNWKVDSC